MFRITLILFIISFQLSSQSFELKNDILNNSISTYNENRNSFPSPFLEIINDFWWDDYLPAASTGYYFISSNSNVNLKPKVFQKFKDTNDINLTWHRIESGPRQRNSDFWNSNSNNEGHFYFRNPADDNPNTSEVEYFKHNISQSIDSTDDAFAGPIPLGLNGAFKFNGIKYDSFYVSTNGLIALSNSRYNYDSFGNRISKNGSIYNIESQDYLVRDTFPNGYADNTHDDYGYNYLALGKNATNRLAGIRARGNKNLNGSNLGDIKEIRTPVIAPIWGDLVLSQFAKTSNKIDDHGKVFYARSDSNTKLHIYIINAQLKGIVKSDRFNDLTLPADLRDTDENYLSCDVQIILDNKDNDITVIYRRFKGVVKSTVNESAANIFKLNTTSGIRGFARHSNYNRKTRKILNLKNEIKSYSNGDLYEYEQFTHYWVNEDISNNNLSSQNYVNYKQHKNTLRTVDIQFNVNDLNKNYLNLDKRIKTVKANEYELFANDEKLNTIQPVAIFQNMSNDIQGVNGINYQKQDLNFKAKFQITNKASGRVIYQKTINVDSTCLASSNANMENCIGEDNAKIRLAALYKFNNNYEIKNYANPNDEPKSSLIFPFDSINNKKSKPYNGLPPYSFVEVIFPAWTASKDDINHIGLLEAKAIAIAEDINGNIIEQDWTYDDTLSKNIYVIKRLDELYDNGTEFHLIDNRPIPSIWKWVSKGAEVVDGNQYSNNPLPPHGIYNASYIDKIKDPNNAWISEKIEAARNYHLYSPSIRMNRKTLHGLEPETNPGGDVITSFPINIKKFIQNGFYSPYSNPCVQISIQRTESRNNWDLGWCDDRLIGPEPRVIFYNNIFNTFDHPNASSQFPDKIVVEFLNPYVDKESERSNHITNVDESRWRMHFRRGGAKTEIGVSALEVFGAGGYKVGFLEDDPDSALANPESPKINSLRANVFDEGIDRTYKRYWIAIPDTFLNMPYDMAENFRFRVRVLANDDGLLAKHGIKGTIPDDDDNFFIDNIELRDSDLEATDIEINNVEIKHKLFSSPNSQVTRIPLSVTLNNNAMTGAPTYYVNTRITKKGFNHSIYNRFEAIPLHRGFTSYTKNMSSLNFRNFGKGEFEITSTVIIPGDTDRFSDNDISVNKIVVGDGESSYGIFNLSDEMAYDENYPNNDIPEIVNKDKSGYSSGLKLHGRNNGSQKQDYFLWNSHEEETGDIGGSGSGQIAVKFDLINLDTIKGVRLYFSNVNSPDDISIAIYDDANGIPGREIKDSRIYRRKGVSDVLVDENNNPLTVYDDYVEYKFDKEFILRGVYWLVVSQLGEEPLHLGASKYRGGTRVTSVYDVNNEPHGLGNIQLSLFDGFRRLNYTGTQKLNDNPFAMENRTGSNEWMQFLPNVGNPVYPHNNFVGLSPNDKQTFTLSRGIWIPMVRLVFGHEKFGPLPNEDFPVELAEFDGLIRNNKAELYWKTESEIDNKGFFLERKLDNEENDKWQRITWINGQGAGNHTTPMRYEYTDESIISNKTYNYRLHQQDIDGAFDNESSGIITLTNRNDKDFEIELTSNNPFNTYFTYTVYLPNSGNINIELCDMFGKKLSTLVNEDLQGGKYNYNWDISRSKVSLSNGIYILRAKFNGKTENVKLIYSK